MKISFEFRAQARQRARMFPAQQVRQDPALGGGVTGARCKILCRSGPNGALFIGDEETVAKNSLHVNDALSGIARLNFRITVATLPHAKMLCAIEIPGTRVTPIIGRDILAAAGGARIKPRRGGA